MQEYVEAAAYEHWLRTGELLSLEGLDATTATLVAEASEGGDDGAAALEPLRCSALDYILGLADVGGELMRYSTKAVARSEVHVPGRVLAFLRELSAALGSLPQGRALPRDWPKKMQVWDQSVKKIETLVHNLAVRRAEFSEEEFQTWLERNAGALDAASNAKAPPADD